MYALALLLSAGTTSATTGLPFFHLGAVASGVPLQWFGMIVALGVVIGSTPLRRYGEWHGVTDDNIRSLLSWLLLSGFAGAHLFDVFAYPHPDSGDVVPAAWWFLPEALWPANWPLPIRFWDGISSYGGFLGGAMGFATFVWWKRLPPGLLADMAIVGLLPAFSIGRIGCTVVSDHIGAAVDPAKWYAFLAMDYPRAGNIGNLADTYPGTGATITAWNLGLIELLYLIPVNALVLWLAFRPGKRSPAGFAAVLTGVLYAPVRFMLDFLRPENTDPRYLGLTFAQWSSILAFTAAAFAATRILRAGKPADTVAPSSAEAQRKLRQALKDADAAYQREEAKKQADADKKAAEVARLRAERDREDAELAKEALAAKPAPAEAEDAAADEAGDDEAKPAAAAASKPAAGKAKGRKR